MLAALVLADRVPASRPPAGKSPTAAVRTAPEPVVRYKISARLEPETHEVLGRAEILWRNTSRVPQSELYFHLYLNAFANDETVFMRSNKPGFRGGRYPETWGGIDIRSLKVFGRAATVTHTPGDSKDATDIRVPLSYPVDPGKEAYIQIEFVSRLPSVTHRTGFADSFHMVAQWFPKLARLEPDGTWAHFPFHRLSEFYADFGDYDVEIDVPRGFLVGATGTEVSRRELRARQLFKFEARGVHDFAWVAWDGFDVRYREGPDRVRLTCLYPKGLDDIAELELDETEAGLVALSEAYGPYPYDGLTVVHPPRNARDAGGMEYPMLITTGGPWWSARAGAKSLHAVTVHELAHQWFYGLVATNEFAYPFLDEGLTTFSSTRALEQRYPGRSAFEGFGWSLSLWALTRQGAARGWDRGAAERSADAFDDGSDYGRLVYAKTATAIETLRRVYGDDVMLALGSYAREQRFRHPKPDALYQAVREHVGDDAADNLKAALRDGAWVDHKVLPDGDGVVLVRSGGLRFDVDVSVIRAMGQERVRWSAGERKLAIDGDGLEAIVIDPDLTVLLDHDLGNNLWRRSPRGVAPRVLSQGGMMTQLLLTVVAP